MEPNAHSPLFTRMYVCDTPEVSSAGNIVSSTLLVYQPFLPGVPLIENEFKGATVSILKLNS